MMKLRGLKMLFNYYSSSLLLIISTVIIGIGCVNLAGCGVVAVSGVASGAAIANDRRTTGTIMDDKAVEIKALHALMQNEALRKQTRVVAVAYNNVVLLVGQAPNTDLKQEAENALRDIPKIAKVYNEIEIQDIIGFSTKAKDSWITTQAKAKLIRAKHASPNRIKIVTENGIVYLMGLATPAEEAEATDIVRNIDGVSKVVQLLENA